MEKEKALPLNSQDVNLIKSLLKTQLRFPLNYPYHVMSDDKFKGNYKLTYSNGYYYDETSILSDNVENIERFSPFGKLNDLLWIQEKHLRTSTPGNKVYYFSDNQTFPIIDEKSNINILRTYSATQMPKWASRITLRITNIKLERLKNISEVDIKKEGFNFIYNDTYKSYDEVKSLYKSYWNSKYKDREWTDNRWVWVIEFLIENIKTK